ncbi:MAG TPA: class I SAM-dependent methyltransferase [Vicinamibacteria bacterium]|nr:class I SAM-dependent methyltransferase [Vicinamibacteria bacterium]
MTAAAPAAARPCWCGAAELTAFGGGYQRCNACGTLVAQHALPAAETVEDGFYGAEYWRGHQERDLGLPDITQRARADLSGRCLHWLRVLLAHRLPPSRVVDVGCGHGAFVALLRWAGFDATGLELSPWVVEYARRTFDVPVHQGTLEAQAFPRGHLGVVVLNDVVEHLQDPARAVGHAAAVLEDDGLLVVQTPCAPEGVSHAALVRAGDSFLKMMEEVGHLFLFTRPSLRLLLERAGFVHVNETPACFGYDMHLVASRRPLTDLPATAAAEALQGTAAGRLVLALLDTARESEARRRRTIAQLLGPTVSRRLLAVLRRLRLA